MEFRWETATLVLVLTLGAAAAPPVLAAGAAVGAAAWDAEVGAAEVWVWPCAQAASATLLPAVSASAMNRRRVVSPGAPSMAGLILVWPSPSDLSARTAQPGRPA